MECKNNTIINQEKHIEIIVPCYNEQECIQPLFDEVSKVLSQIKDYSYSLLFVDDGSNDHTLDEIRRLAEEREEVKVRFLSFSRNFGKEAAIYAGLERCEGDVIVLMDADLQHPPSLIPELVSGLSEGYDCCGARRVSRKGEPVFRGLFSKAFYALINHVTSMNLVPGGSDYRAMKKYVVDAAVQLSERERFTKGILSWIGFKTKWIEYENVPRYAGKSKWSFIGLARYAWKGYFAFAASPLRIAVAIGIITIIISLVYAIRVLIQAFILENRPWSDTTTIILLLLFLGGIIIMLLGIIGEYLAKIYCEIKHRPIYITKESRLKHIDQSDDS